MQTVLYSVLDNERQSLERSLESAGLTHVLPTIFRAKVTHARSLFIPRIPDNHVVQPILLDSEFWGSALANNDGLAGALVHTISFRGDGDAVGRFCKGLSPLCFINVLKRVQAADANRVDVLYQR